MSRPSLRVSLHLDLLATLFQGHAQQMGLGGWFEICLIHRK
jgi:hypothetical protein